MVIIRHVSGSYFVGRFEFSANERDAKRFAAPAGAKRRLDKLASTGMTGLEIVPVVGRMPAKPKADAESPKPRKGRRAKADDTAAE